MLVTTVEDLEEGYEYNMGTDNFNVAFSLATAKDEMLDFDPRYVQWLVMVRR